MDKVCLALPILPGKTDAARLLHLELETTRKDESDRSQRRLGVVKEYWYLASLASGDQFLVYIEVPDFQTAMPILVQSQDPFDLWLKERLLNITGVDFGNPPADFQLPESLSRYDA